jgi:hypothetical protein
VRITPAAVAKEARRSRNPLYITHRALLAEIEAAATGPTPASDLAATVARLEANNAELRGVIRQLRMNKRDLATENLTLLHRARLAEDRLAARDREIAALKRSSVVTRPSANVIPKQVSGERAVSALHARASR